MPEFATPAPITALLELVVADVRVTASDRADTSVEVRPSDPGHEPDVRAAEQTRVELTSAGLLVKAPKQRGIAMFSKPGSIDVTIGLPAGSRLTVDAGVLSLRSAGQLGACRIKAGAGSIEVDQIGPAEISTGAGSVSAGQVDGNADIHTGSGRVRLSAVAGTATVKNSNGDTWVGDVTGDVRVTSSNGSIAVDHAGAAVTARSANGSLRVGALLRGAAQLKTAFGEIEIGLAEGTAAMVDAHTRMGTVHNLLTAADRPGPADQVAQVHAQTSFGDIVIRRA